MKGVEFLKGSKVMCAQDVGVHVFQFFIEIAISWGHEMSGKGTIQFFKHQKGVARAHALTTKYKVAQFLRTLLWAHVD